jgi:hypothetical protein
MEFYEVITNDYANKVISRNDNVITSVKMR